MTKNLSFRFKDYMEDVHGKEISLQYVTVKVPGQKPRGSKTIMSLSSSNHHSNNGISEHLSNISISNFQLKDKRTADKVLLTGFEQLKEPSYKNGGSAYVLLYFVDSENDLLHDCKFRVRETRNLRLVIYHYERKLYSLR